MSLKSILGLAGLALAITPAAMVAIDAASARQPAPVPVPTPVAELRADMENAARLPGSAQVCGPAVRVVATGYGEPKGQRCTARQAAR
ncbi:hypothetical protein SLNSH_13020 [Alsobacter soli]|uniref:Porin n=1 Tax=Alsobacter soli TaxID=2109933 RepID=A0A2T1HSP5_9HYPH|nr:hypothetical protein [Alsobacter soli]PSC04683.1 hypothetical protein SLNSH_13020 [Alsobacter soli]